MPCRAVPCRAVPCRAAPCRAGGCRRADGNAAMVQPKRGIPPGMVSRPAWFRGLPADFRPRFPLLLAVRYERCICGQIRSWRVRPRACRRARCEVLEVNAVQLQRDLRRKATRDGRPRQWSCRHWPAAPIGSSRKLFARWCASYVCVRACMRACGCQKALTDHSAGLALRTRCRNICKKASMTAKSLLGALPIPCTERQDKNQRTTSCPKRRTAPCRSGRW